MALYLYSLWQRHLVTEALTFSVFFLVSEAPLHTLSPCRCREAKKKLSRALLNSPFQIVSLPLPEKFYILWVFNLHCIV